VSTILRSWARILVLAELDGCICSVERNQLLWEIRLRDPVKELGYHRWFWEMARESSDGPFDNGCIYCTGALVVDDDAFMATKKSFVETSQSTHGAKYK
jgi:hypothetical protein